MIKPHGYLAGIKWVIIAHYCPFGQSGIIDPVYEAYLAEKSNNGPFSVLNYCILVIIDPAWVTILDRYHRFSPADIYRGREARWDHYLMPLLPI